MFVHSKKQILTSKDFSDYTSASVMATSPSLIMDYQQKYLIIYTNPVTKIVWFKVEVTYEGGSLRYVYPTIEEAIQEYNRR